MAVTEQSGAVQRESVFKCLARFAPSWRSRRLRRRLARRRALCIASSYLVVVGCVAAGCGEFQDESPPRSVQGSLRGVAQRAPAGKYAYWLGHSFHGARVTAIGGTWKGYVIVSYNLVDSSGEPTVSVDVISFPERAEEDQTNLFSTRVRTATAQEVTIRVRRPKHPSAEFIRKVKSAIHAVPEDVEYEGDQL